MLWRQNVSHGSSQTQLPRPEGFSCSQNNIIYLIVFPQNMDIFSIDVRSAVNYGLMRIKEVVAILIDDLSLI